MADGVEFEEFVRTRSHHLLRLAYALTGDHALAEDLLQTALARSWSAWRRVNGDPEPYVRRVLVNTFNSWWGRRWRGELPTETLPERVAAGPPSAVEDRDEVRRALLRLPRQQRAVVVLRFLEDLSEAQTAELLGITPGAVKTHSSRALARLRLDPSLTALPETAPAGTERVVAVRERISQRRRARVLTIGAACAVVLALILGYALAPDVFHRSLPPAERKIGVFSEYERGYHIVAMKSAPLSETGRVTITWRLESLDYVLRYFCQLNPKATRVFVALEIEESRIGGAECGDTPGPGPGQADYPLTGFLADHRYAVGDEVTGTLVLYDSEGPLPTRGTMAVAVGVAVPLDQYPLPARPKNLKPLEHTPINELSASGTMVTASGPHSTEVMWEGGLVVKARSQTPGTLHVIVDGVEVGLLSWWDYRQGSWFWDLTPADARRAGLSLTEDRQITIALVPQFMSGDWYAYLQT
ncbi:SigE family RNA polymerase sigma factor [Hamadaea tsunoensis]|uniref:SigE family RNA polymerase sigma factor n=1 Tax=Hamadaea tsunoensis TaxID=53368 RepID=UPI0007E8C85B|nr:SigE family RNA polymerase sigma factor [Hamadaea tsunoensis]